MQGHKINILSTRPLSQSLIDQAFAAGLNMEVISFIETEPLQTIEVQQEIEQVLLQTATVVFTSGSAVEAVAAGLEGQQPNWEIYCLGNTTRELVVKYFGGEIIIGTANNALELAEVIASSSPSDEVIFFCGDQRRADLPDSLHDKGIEVEEIVVYQTVSLPQKLKRNYEGILFFSPTAVRSFFEANNNSDKTIFFAIGNTTASEIKNYTKNKILVSDEPSKEKLVEMAIEFFT